MPNQLFISQASLNHEDCDVTPSSCSAVAPLPLSPVFHITNQKLKQTEHVFSSVRQRNLACGESISGQIWRTGRGGSRLGSQLEHQKPSINRSINKYFISHMTVPPSSSSSEHLIAGAQAEVTLSQAARAGENTFEVATVRSSYFMSMELKAVKYPEFPKPDPTERTTSWEQDIQLV
ncbi:hypothetical protein E5288_WYG018479 [Bos mutus]|uniref:Uncharacterized protein n=1 Tax=Bos mutus TaxID=72004 RepID=A0A6B0RXI8_9CETA|nr:hypothetical protein [Bos mutus]